MRRFLVASDKLSSIHRFKGTCSAHKGHSHQYSTILPCSQTHRCLANPDEAFWRGQYRATGQCSGPGSKNEMSPRSGASVREDSGDIACLVRVISISSIHGCAHPRHTPAPHCVHTRMRSPVRGLPQCPHMVSSLTCCQSRESRNTTSRLPALS